MDSLGDRMKGYEAAWGQVLPERTPVIVRVDGKAFHTATRGLNKPWDVRIANAMKATAVGLLNSMQNAVFAYQQSDEISILMTNYSGEFTQSWYGNKVQKIVSVSASIATKMFNDAVYLDKDLEFRDWLFDARAFSLPREEVRNYFVWRQVDAKRNSVSSLARCFFSQKELQGKPTKEMIEMLKGIGVDWEAVHSHYRLGVAITQGEEEERHLHIHGVTPNFVTEKSFFEPLVNPASEVQLVQELTIL